MRVVIRRTGTACTEVQGLFVPKRRNYYIESLYSHYAHTHYAEHLDITREIISEKYPEYLESFDKVMKQTGGYMFNMYIMEKSLSDAYCEWLFDILFELEKRVGDKSILFSREDFMEESAKSSSMYGWQTRKKKSKRSHISIWKRSDWKKKGMAFLKAKFGNKKYEGSF